ncbi:hypothetical protein [Hymenobacter guriensis]|uniref:Cyclase n=1 Tax=Hymenobacter guriensis TaxID=2793065 RepID=A0ABS0L0J9_9BACT|nr:hypothetical protein [Hymenobacter guriensis]MBG8553642.1 cyclase [Hymenobacter guriensis]
MANNDSIHTLASHEVEDFATWKQGFDAAAPHREKHGLKIHGVYQAHDNPNMVTIHGEAPSAEALQQFSSDPEFVETAKNAGVKGHPEFKVLRKHS